MLRLNFSWDRRERNFQLDFNAGHSDPPAAFFIIYAASSLSGLAAVFLVRRSLLWALQLTLLSDVANFIFLSLLLNILNHKVKETKFSLSSTPENYKGSLTISYLALLSMEFLSLLGFGTAVTAAMMSRESPLLGLVYFVASARALLAMLELGLPPHIVDSHDFNFISSLCGLHLTKLIGDKLVSHSQEEVDGSEESLTNDGVRGFGDVGVEEDNGYETDGHDATDDEARADEGSSDESCSVVDHGHEGIDDQHYEPSGDVIDNGCGIDGDEDDGRDPTAVDDDMLTDEWQWEHVMPPAEEEEEVYGSRDGV